MTATNTIEFGLNLAEHLADTLLDCFSARFIHDGSAIQASAGPQVVLHASKNSARDLLSIFAAVAIDELLRKGSYIRRMRGNSVESLARDGIVKVPFTRGKSVEAVQTRR